MSGFGGMVSVQVRGGAEAALEVVRRVRLFTRATSLGGPESLIEHRASVEGPESRTPPGLLRLSIGLEHPADLVEDLDQALRGGATLPVTAPVEFAGARAWRGGGDLVVDLLPPRRVLGRLRRPAVQSSYTRQPMVGSPVTRPAAGGHRRTEGREDEASRSKRRGGRR